VTAAGDGKGGDHGKGGDERGANFHTILLSKRPFQAVAVFGPRCLKVAGRGMPGIERDGRSC
jgi:hypothetical protein